MTLKMLMEPPRWPRVFKLEGRFHEMRAASPCVLTEKLQSGTLSAKDVSTPVTGTEHCGPQIVHQAGALRGPCACRFRRCAVLSQLC